jgi:dimethylamine corrinoid protein
MNSGQETFEELNNAIRACDEEASKKAARKAVVEKADLIKCINGIFETMKGVVERFNRNEIFLPHVSMATDAMEAAMAILQEHVPKEKLAEFKIGTIVTGTVEGDMHDIGLNMISMALQSEGFEVHCLGKNVTVDQFIDQAQQVGADIIGASSLLTVTMFKHKDLVEEVRRRALPFKVMVGGAPVTREWASQIGADGYGEDIEETVQVAKRLIEAGDTGEMEEK